MDSKKISVLLKKQKAYFESGATLDINFRLKMLRRLKRAIISHSKDIEEAIREDLGKSSYESYMCETGLVLSEISHMEKHIKCYASEKRVLTPMAQYISRSYTKPSPYGNVLIISPWNYPFLLTIEPLVDAIAAGNTAIVKPSAYSPATSRVMADLLRSYFKESYIAVVTGGREENTALLNQKFDMIFFTGSQAVGKEVLRKAAEHLTPVALELGGKSPCIVDASANIKLAAKRIVWGKFLNCGQTCVAPDYILCEKSVEKQLLEALKKEIIRQFGALPLLNSDYGKIINEKHFNRILGLIDSKKIYHGGLSDKAALRIEPTILQNVSWTDPVMQEEIFGPVLPVLTFDSIPEVIKKINKGSEPLALYIFSSDKFNIRKVISKCKFGGGCINDTVIHLATSNMGFGGVGASGMGSYHGKTGFETFSHRKSIVDKKTIIDLPMRYQPFTEFNRFLIKMFVK